MRASAVPVTAAQEDPPGSIQQFCVQRLDGCSQAARFVHRAEKLDVGPVRIVLFRAVQAGTLRPSVEAAAPGPGYPGPLVVPAGGFHPLTASWLVALPIPHLSEAVTVKLILASRVIGAELFGPQLPPGAGRPHPRADGRGDPADGGDPFESITHTLSADRRWRRGGPQQPGREPAVPGRAAGARRAGAVAADRRPGRLG